MNTHDVFFSERFADDLPTVRDPAFTLAVLQRLERRRLWRNVGVLTLCATAALFGLSALTPALNDMTATLIAAPETLGAVAIALLTALAVGMDELGSFDLDS